MSLVRRIARPLLASIFITEGIDTLRRPNSRVPAAESAIEKCAKPRGVSVDPKLAVRTNGAVMATCGLMLASGKAPRLAATALSASLIATTIIGHPFWSMKDPDERRTHRKAFTRNLVFLGGLLHAAVDTDGKPSRAWRRANEAA